MIETWAEGATAAEAQVREMREALLKLVEAIDRPYHGADERWEVREYRHHLYQRFIQPLERAILAATKEGA
jgi:hypothetical protein